MAHAPVTVLAGPRAIGKSTLLRGLAADLDRGVIDLEDKLARRTPQAIAEFGALLETFVANELLKQTSSLDDVVTAGHWRTRHGEEVDVVFERFDGGVAGVEVKAGGRVDARDADGLAALADRVGGAWLGGVVLYTGRHPYALDRARNLYVLPVDALWLTSD